MSTICVIGLWHQATVLSACLADMGHEVRLVGEEESTVRELREGKLPVYEPGLESMIRESVSKNRLTFTTNYREALKAAEFVYIAIDTPVSNCDEPDLSPVFEAAQKIGQSARGDLIVIVGSQVPVGTSEKVIEIVRREQKAHRFRVAYVPEFLRLGKALETFKKAERFVFGSDDYKTIESVARIYAPLDRPTFKTNLRTAEMAKHASNAFLATSISFVNEIADLCDEVGADILQVAEILKLDQRIGPRAFLTAGLGFAGGTLGRDLRALQSLARDHGKATHLVDAVLRVNDGRPALVNRQLRRIYGSLEGLQVCIFGLTYKPGTSTLRRSVALDIVRELNRENVVVKAFDPLARIEEERDLPSFEFFDDPYEACRGCDAVVLVTEWEGTEKLDLNSLRESLKAPVFIDTRNRFDPAAMEKAGIIYLGVGRGRALTRPGKEPPFEIEK